MALLKREIVRMERQLIKFLTEACETAKAEIIGFDWLTHEVDYSAFPQSLHVIWVFDSRVHKESALSNGQGSRMRKLTIAALSEADVHIGNTDACVRFDSEEECHEQNGGDWRARVAQHYRKKE